MPSFQIKNFPSITASMMNWMRATTKKVTDFNIGSIVRTMLEAVAAEIDQLYQQLFLGIRQAIPVSVFSSFNFAALPEITASGPMAVAITAAATDVLVSAGTIFSQTVTSVTYTSQADVTIPAGSTAAVVQVLASVAGPTGNLAAGTVFTPSPTPAGFVSATNQTGFVNGVVAETPAAQKTRFATYVQNLQRATVSAIDVGLATVQLTDAAGNITEQVLFSKVVEPYLTDNTQPVGLFDAYIHNGSTGASSDLLTQANLVINGYTNSAGIGVPGWKAAGTQIVIAAATNEALNVVGTLTIAANATEATVLTAAQAAISAYILASGIGGSALFAEIVALVMGTSGVVNFDLTSPSADTTASASTKLMPGTITLTPVIAG